MEVWRMENKFSNVWQSLVSNLNFMGVTKKVLFEIQVYQSSQVDISTSVDDSSPSFGWKLTVDIPPVWGIIVKQLAFIFEGFQLVSETSWR